MLKIACFLFLASLPSIAYTNSEVDTPQCCDPFLPPAPIESCQVPVGYFYPAQYTFGDCGLDISVSGEFIYWEVNRDSLSEYGAKVDILNNGNEQIQHALLHHQGYRPGFKVAAGMGLPGCDAWKLDVEYTWFHHTSTNNVRASENGFISLPFFQLLFNPARFFFRASSVKSVVKFNLDFLHGIVGRTFYLTQRFIVNANVGLKSWWSEFDSNSFFNTPEGTQAALRSKSGCWGIGPYVTAQIKGLLWCGTYLFGKAGVWPNYTRFNKFSVVNSVPAFAIPFPPFEVPPFTNTERNPTYYYVTQLFYEGGIGLGWGTYLCDCDYHIDLLIGYDMMTTYVRAFSITSGDTHKEFYYQGLSVKAQFDF
jgi:hypothetical protein